MMRLGDTKTLAAGQRRVPVADRPLAEILRIPHTVAILARLARLSVDSEGGGALELRALHDAKDDALERDKLLAGRPENCWCFGRGGTGERAVLVPGAEVPMVLSVYCTCHDAIDRRAADDDVRRQGRAFHEQQRVSTIWEAARVPERFDGCTLQTFPVTSGSMSIVLRRVQNWLTTDEWALVLRGPFGVGKTGIGIGALRAAAEQHTVGLFVKAPDLLTRIRATYGKSADVSELDVIKSLSEVPLLMLDDVGADRQTDWATALLFQVLDARHDNSLKTIVTTNLAPPDLALHLGARTMHRFDEGAVVLTVDGPNLRKESKP